MNARLFLIFLIVFTNLIGAGVVVPTLPLYAEGQFAATPLEVALFWGLFHMAQFFAAPKMGQLSDFFGRKPILFWSQIGTLFAFLLFIYAAPLSNYLGVEGLIILYVARLLDGITGGNITAAQAYITDITPQKERAQAFGYLQIAFASGLILGPACGGFLANFGLAAPFVGAMVLTSISALLTLFFLTESLPHDKRAPMERQPFLVQTWGKFLRNPLIALLLALAFVVSFLIAALSGMFPLYADRIVFGGNSAETARNVGYMLAFLGAIAVLTQLTLLKPLSQRLGEHNLIVLALATTLLTCIGLSTLSHPALITLSLAPAAFAYAAGIPAGQALLMHHATDSTRGQLIGLYQATNSLAYFVGPLVSGYLFQQFTPRAPFIFATILIGATLSAIFPFRKKLHPSSHLREV